MLCEAKIRPKNMTLTQTAVLTKQIVILAVITLILGISGFIVYNIWRAYYLAHLPPVEEKPDNKFGLLPRPDFPKSNVSSSNFSYSLDTTTGGLPRIGKDTGFEKLIKVYFVNQSFATFLSPDKSQALAAKFNIISLPEILTETKYKFRDIEKSLLVDLDTGNFSYAKEATVSAKTGLSEDDKLISNFKQILSNLGVLKNDLANGRSKITPLKKEGKSLIPTQVRSEAQAAEISIWPDPIDKRPIYTSNFNKSLINATVIGSSDNLENYQILNFTYYPIDTSTFATYQIKTAEEAFDDLKTGKGVVVVEPSSPQVSITSVNLGYFLADNYSPYLQPIFIFEGPGFVAYVDAANSQVLN